MRISKVQLFFIVYFAIFNLMNAFSLISKQKIPTMDASATLFRHKSGFEVYYIDAKDEESFFCYQFKTYPSSSNGVFHILEHTILSGSEKYPLRDPFSAISRSTCNTYLNALTFPDKTMYPAASPLKKDFDNIFSIYSDAVFRPLLRKETFLAEGIRIKSNPPSFDGVVFNEMRTDTLSHESVVSSHSLRDLFPNTMYSFSSGGDAKSIVTLTYEEYLEAYEKYYHPSNGGLFLYGENIDVEEKLNILSEYLKDVKEREKLPLYEKTPIWSEPREEVCYSSNQDDRITVIISFLTTLLNTSAYDRMFISILVDALLGSPSCPLYKALLESNLADDISSQSGMSGDFYEIPFSVGITGVKSENISKAKEYILTALKEISQKGLEKDLIEAAIRRQEFSSREISGGIPNGFRMLLRFSRSWARGEDIIEDLSPSISISKVRASWEKNSKIFDEFILRELVNNNHRLTLTVISDDKKAQEEERVLEEEALKRVNKKSIEDEKLFEAFVSKPDSIEDINKIPKLMLSDVPVKGNDIVDEVIDNIIVQKQLTGGIIYFDIAIDISDKSNKDLLYYSILSRELSVAGLIGEEKSLIHRRLRLLTGSYSFFVETGKKQDGATRASFIVRVKVLRDNLKEVLVEIFNLLTRCDVLNNESVKSALNDIKTDFQENITYAATSFAASAASASLTPSLSLGEDVMGIKAWQEFTKMNVKDSSEKLKELFPALSEKNRYLVHLTLEAADSDYAINETKEFLSKLSLSNEVIPLKREISESETALFYPLPVPVSYNAIALESSTYGSLDEACEEIIANMLSSGALWDAVRTCSGAYGVEMIVDPLEGSIVTATYNDPNIKKTYETIENVINTFEIKDEDIENAKLSILGKLLKPLSPSSRAMVGFRRYLYGITPNLRAAFRSNILLSTKDDIKRAREIIVKRLSNSSKATLGSKEVFEKEDIKLTQRPLIN